MMAGVLSTTVTHILSPDTSDQHAHKLGEVHCNDGSVRDLLALY